VALFDARVNLLVESIAFQDAVAISSVSNNDLDTVMRWPQSRRVAFIEVYKRQNPPPDGAGRPSSGSPPTPGASYTVTVPDDD
jgi:hypothetical protein